MQPDASFELGRGPFEAPKMPFKVGELRTRTWRAPLVHGLTDVWRNRCREYWDRVSQRYGVIFTDHRTAYDGETETVTTMAAVLWIAPGDRYPARQSEEIH